MNRAKRRALHKQYKHLKFTSIDQAKRFLLGLKITNFKRNGVWVDLEQATTQEVVDIMHHNFGCWIYQEKDMANGKA